MRKLFLCLLLPLCFSCKHPTADNTPSVSLSRNDNSLLLHYTAAANAGKTTLWLNGRLLTGIAPDKDQALPEDRLQPGMNTAWLICTENGHTDTLADSVYYSRRVYYSLVTTYPHDPAHFTEGLFLEGDLLYESTGLEEHSGITRYRMGASTITALDSFPMTDKKIFGEGIAAVGERLFQLSWKNHVVFEYHKSSLKPVKQYDYPEEGWGLCRMGDSLVASDGKPWLYFIDPAGFRVYRKIALRDENGPLANLNEIDYAGRYIAGNIWQTSRIVFIDPASGNVVGDMSLDDILSSAKQENQGIDVMNGIAYDPASHTFLVTGKWWRKIYRIRLDAPSARFLNIE